jgi:hypothetical protein
LVSLIARCVYTRPLARSCVTYDGSLVARRRPRKRRRHLIALGIHPDEVMKASRCRRGYWWMSGNGIVQRALDNRWLREQGVPDLKSQWIELHYGGAPAPHMDIASVNLTGIA